MTKAEQIFEKHIGLNTELGYLPYKKENIIAAINEALSITAVVQAKPEVCQCPEDDDNVYLNKLEWHCCYCKKPVRQTSC